MLGDRVTLGIVRLLVTAAGLYVIGSILVLVMRGRWARAISTTGIEADTASDSDRLIEELQAKLSRALEERDDASRLLWRILHG